MNKEESRAISRKRAPEEGYSHSYDERSFLYEEIERLKEEIERLRQERRELIDQLDRMAGA
jgi:hypothetical protein